MPNEKVCPYCRGAEQIRLKSENANMLDRNGRPIKDYRYYTCFCVNNKFISKCFNRLRGIPDISPKEALNAGKFAGFRNLLIFGNEIKFLHLVKSTMVLHANYHRTFEILNGYDIVKRYYVEQQDGTQRTLEDLENKSLLIFLFDVSTENKAQNKVIFEVIKRRIIMNDPNKMAAGKKIERPTWIYASSKEHFKESKEYSTEIESLIENFKVLDLIKYSVPFSIRDKNRRSEINVNQRLGNL